jgi:hypothetical protein
VSSTSPNPKLRPSDGVHLAVAEYESLRAEILKLVELQFQIIGLTVLAFGTILSVGLQTKNAAIMLLHPLLSLILGVSWLNHAHGISRCAEYITQHIEAKLGVDYMGWENYVQRHPISGGRISFWGVRAIFFLAARSSRCLRAW